VTSRSDAGTRPSRTVVITQSNYLPWRGYFDLIRQADELILLDSVQYTRRDWRNRNKIKTASGPLWLTVPVEVKGLYHQAIDEVRVADRGWSAAHRRAIELAYGRAPHFPDGFAWLDGLLADLAGETSLACVNEALLRALCARLGIATPIRRCTDVLERETLKRTDATGRLVDLAIAVGATRYLTGSAAQGYLDVSAFTRRGIEVEWMSYEGYPDYPQLWGAFEPAVSVIDLLLNTGPDAPAYLGRPVVTVQGGR
jgi:WbqC-like protein family